VSDTTKPSGTPRMREAGRAAVEFLRNPNISSIDAVTGAMKIVLDAGEAIERELSGAYGSLAETTRIANEEMDRHKDELAAAERECVKAKDYMVKLSAGLTQAEQRAAAARDAALDEAAKVCFAASKEPVFSLVEKSIAKMCGDEIRALKSAMSAGKEPS